MSDVTDALELARRGLHVFPVDSPELEKCAGIGQQHDPETCTERGKHPCVAFTRHASVDPAQIAAWFTGYPRNIGVACGLSGLLVVDEDTRGDFARFADSIGETVPDTFTVQTGRGLHFYFAARDGLDLGNREGALKDDYGVNIRGRGGYVIGPGSLHATGALYSVTCDADPVPVPSWLVDAVNGPHKASEPFSRPDDKPRGLAAIQDVIRGPRNGMPGERHGVLVSYASSLRGRDVPLAEAVHLFRLAWQRCEQPPVCETPLTWDEARAKLVDCYQRYTPNYPRPDPVTLTEGDDLDEAAAWEMDQAAAFALAVSAEAHKIKVRDSAREKVTAEKLAAAVLPDPVRLDDFLAGTDEDAHYRVTPLWPTGGRVVLSAQHKAGKTVLAGNLIRSLVDAQPFLDIFDISPTARVVLIDDELDERMLRRWLRDQGISHAERVTVVSLRGRLSAFNILDAATRTRWAGHIGAADVLILDCLRPALDALGLSEDKDAGRFLEALDELTREAGIAETLVVHHMGHQGERSRGDSRILDWPDAVWKLVRDAEDSDDASAGSVRRYLAAYGRDVDQGETLLSFDPVTRRLSVAGGSRRDRKVDEARDAVIDTMAEYGEPLSGRAIEERLRDAGPGRATIRAALKRAIDGGDVLVSEGLRNAKLHTLNPLSAPVRRSAPPVRRRTEFEGPERDERWLQMFKSVPALAALGGPGPDIGRWV